MCAHTTKITLTIAPTQAGDRVLVAEACNHNRITQLCNDIGLVQIPAKIEATAGGGVVVEHAFGREFPELDDPGESGSA
jgi:hypothetical protein